MKVYTEKDLESFERDEDGRLICPSGDYTQISSFGERCRFGAWCIFEEWCSFEECCSFGERCRFGGRCIFEECCSFGRWCIFGKDCNFCERCSFGYCCYFYDGCKFGGQCSFGDNCNLDNNLKFESIPDNVERVLKIDCIGSRKGCTYFFKTQNEIYVRCGCFFGTIAEFENKVNETHKDNERYRKEYLNAIQYVKSIM